MILGSHNSMSYLPPKHWWMWPFNFMARCQSKSLKEQYDSGARVFDIRIAYDKHIKPHFRHGMMAYKGEIEPVMIFLNEKKDCVVRIILEEYYQDFTDVQETAFIMECRRWEKKYPDIQFVCGVRKRDWTPLTTFIDIEDKIQHKYASMQGGKLNDLWPWLYAKLHNRKHLAELANDDCILFVDFVNIK